MISTNFDKNILCLEIHRGLLHRYTPFYLISIDNVPLNEINSIIGCFQKGGNEIMNSLFEFKQETAQSYLKMVDKSEFIRHKYLNKSFINDSKVEKRDILIEILEANVKCGSNIAMTCFYLFLLSDLNYHQNFDYLIQLCSQEIMINYLNFNNHQRYNSVIEGTLKQVYNLSNKPSCQKQLYNLNKTEIVLNDEIINYSTIVRISPLSSENSNLIEFNYCSSMNSSLITHHFTFQTDHDLQQWLNAISNQITLNSNEISQFNIKMFGHLFIKTEMISQTDAELAQTFLIEDKMNRIPMILFIKRRDGPNFVDLRQIIEIKMDPSSFIHLIMESRNKQYFLTSQGDFSNLNKWYQQLNQIINSYFKESDDKSIEKHYLTKDFVPIILEKCCCDIELNYMGDLLFYNTKTSAVDLKQVPLLYDKLKNDTHYQLDHKSPTTTDLIRLFLIKNRDCINEYLNKLRNSEITNLRYYDSN
jgi:hypothetical protein